MTELAQMELSDEERQAAEKEKSGMRANFAGYWAVDREIILPGGDKFTFKDHEYLYKSLMRVTEKSKDKQPQIRVKKKGTQTGGSISKVIECLHYGVYGIVNGIGYIMPSDPEVQAFGKTKFAPLIQNNPNYIGKYVKSGGKGTDSAELKKIGETFIHFKSASSNKQIQGENTSSAATSFSCDVLVFDEYDMMDTIIADKFLGRIDHSDYKIVEYLSNPTLEDFGIDALFEQSDQQYWHWLCPKCLRFTCPDLDFINGVPEKSIKCNVSGYGYIACVHCGQPLPLYYRDSKTRLESCWVPQYPGKTIEGEHYSHLMTPRYHDPYKLLMSFYNPPAGSLKEIMRKDFGCAYTAKEDQLRASDVRACCGNEPMPGSHTGPCIAGVDVMNVIHAIIGYRTSRETFEIIKSATVKDFKELYDLFKRYNVKSAGIDVAPDIHAAKEFQKTVKSLFCRAWLVDYKTSKHVGPYGFDDVNMIIKANRTEVMDMSHNLVMDKKIILPRQEQCDELIKQICKPAKMQQKNPKTGILEYYYTKGVDHFRHCLNYFLLAGQKATVVKSPGSKKTKVVSEYQRC
jgi:hypothetical protein